MEFWVAIQWAASTPVLGERTGGGVEIGVASKMLFLVASPETTLKRAPSKPRIQNEMGVVVCCAVSSDGKVLQQVEARQLRVISDHHVNDIF